MYDSLLVALWIGQARPPRLAAPSMRRVLPLTNAAAGLSRKTIAALTSDSVPMRLSGTCSRRVGITALKAPS
ncbi:hypothetical protein D9M71_738600 [compost metagenome]